MLCKISVWKLNQRARAGAPSKPSARGAHSLLCDEASGARRAACLRGHRNSNAAPLSWTPSPQQVRCYHMPRIVHSIWPARAGLGESHAQSHATRVSCLQVHDGASQRARAGIARQAAHPSCVGPGVKIKGPSACSQRSGPGDEIKKMDPSWHHGRCQQVGNGACW
jgi:hypothetical protein